MKELIDEYLDSIGEKGSIERLKAIASLDIGVRSEAAKRVIKKRSVRRLKDQLGKITSDLVNVLETLNKKRNEKTN